MMRRVGIHLFPSDGGDVARHRSDPDERLQTYRRRQGRRRLGGGLADDEPGDLTILEDVSHVGCRRIRIDRHVGSSGLHDPVERHQHLEGLVGVEPDPVALGNAVAQEEVGETVGPIIQFAVRHLLPAETKRRMIRVSFGDSGDGFREQGQRVHAWFHGHKPSILATRLRWMSLVPA